MAGGVARAEHRGHGGVAAAAAAYARGGYLTVVDGIIGPRWFYPSVRDALRAAGCGVAYAILRPSLEVAVRRARARSTEPLSDPDVVAKLWAGFDALEARFGRHLFDTTDETPEETARRVGDRLAAGALAAS